MKTTGECNDIALSTTNSMRGKDWELRFLPVKNLFLKMVEWLSAQFECKFSQKDTPFIRYAKFPWKLIFFTYACVSGVTKR